MNLIDIPKPVAPFVRMASKVSALMPRQILTLRHYKTTHRIINWKHPRDLQEYVLAKLMLARRDKEQLAFYAMLADKVDVRDFVRRRVGDSILTRVYGVWNDPDDIDFGALPERFVLKTNNGCGTNMVVTDKSELDTAAAKRTLRKWLKFPYGELSGQSHYAKIKPRIFAEEFLVQKLGEDILPYDYKFFCFNGEPKFILYYEGRNPNGHITPNMVFDLEWNPMPEMVKRPTEHSVPAPESLRQMADIARKLSEGLDFVRVDMYEIDGRPLFGEMTLTPDVYINFTDEFLLKNCPSL